MSRENEERNNKRLSMNIPEYVNKTRVALLLPVQLKCTLPQPKQIFSTSTLATENGKKFIANLYLNFSYLILTTFS